MDMNGMAKMLMLMGGLLFIAGLLFYLAAHFNFPLFKLPGDIFIKKENFSFSFPIVSCIVISIILSVIMNLFRK